MNIKTKFTAAKDKIKNHLPEIITVSSAVIAVVVAVRTNEEIKKLNAQKEEFHQRENEFLDFIGNGPDYIAISPELAEKIENGRNFGHNLAGGTRVLLSRAEPLTD